MNRAKFIQDVGDLIVFGTGLWGLISILSILLPVINAAIGPIPLGAGVAVLATVLAVIAAFFAFVYSSTEKTHILEFEMRRPFYRGEVINPRKDMLHNAASRFGWAFVSLGVYLAITALLGVLRSDNGEAAKWVVPVVEPLSVIFYGLAFGLVTGAFGSLAVMQHARQQPAPSRLGSVNLGIKDETRTVAQDRPLPSSPDGVGDSQQESQ